ncbi:MAG: hypothetical protein A2896_01240 [Candidatus Nealsonbacteria bacterium RIFCSPLOWO2_01_FULL_43_32]|uniref:Type II secretion system protein GspG C-terminal domain-containing protein n=1 Tax=Candidatus Nealsonbacteria bacterium RIFCSPLOWO2_01_FULL_43_32 TaxID=1801672 RepID=A0A1G2EF51_9BACT|nr:MAG: hypothetical protein A2896_01240 [Candidatus Nealsonbacteria bacterium RIFCSPLOWO2_01_FULL_43_32]
MLQIFTKKRRGFTLIELLVVIAIIGILSSIVLVSMGGVRKSARDTVRKSDMSQIGKAQEMFYGANEKFFESTGATWPTVITGYMLKVPTDPTTGTATPYVWRDNFTAAGDEQKFCVYATLEAPAATTYYATSHQGNFECTDAAPTLLDCCF